MLAKHIARVIKSLSVVLQKKCELHNKALNLIIDAGTLIVFFLIFTRLIEEIFEYEVTGKDDIFHIINLIKIAQSNCSWLEILSFYSNINYTPYQLQLHYPPLAYFSSWLICATGIDYRIAVALSNIIWMWLGYLSIAASAVIITKSRYTAIIAALFSAPVLLALSTENILRRVSIGYFIHDPGWRMAAFGIVGFSVWAFLRLKDHSKPLVSWLVIGIILGVNLLIHLIAFFSSMIFLILLIFCTEKPKSLSLKIVACTLGFIGVALIFYFPLASLEIQPFLRELSSEGVVIKEKVAHELLKLPKVYLFFLEFYGQSNALSLAILILALIALLIGLFLGDSVTRALIFSYFASHISLLIGRTVGAENYLVGTLALFLTAVPISLYWIASRAFSFHLISIILVGFLVFALKFSSPDAERKSGISWDPDLIGRATEKYIHLKQDEIFIADCISTYYRDKATLVLTLQRPQESTHLPPIFTKTIWARKNGKFSDEGSSRPLPLENVKLVLWFKPLDENTKCSSPELEQIESFVKNLKKQKRWKVRNAIMEIYER